MHDIEGALSDFNNAITLGENDTTIFLDRYSVFFVLKNKKDDCADLLNAKNLGSIYAKNHYKTTCTF